MRWPSMTWRRCDDDWWLACSFWGVDLGAIVFDGFVVVVVVAGGGGGVFFPLSFLGQVSKHCPQTAKLGKLATASRQTKSTSPKLRCAQFLSLVTEDESGICDMIVFSWKIHGFVKVKGRSQLVDVYHTTPIFLSVLMGNQQLGEDPVSLTTWFIDLDTSVVGWLGEQNHNTSVVQCGTV